MAGSLTGELASDAVARSEHSLVEVRIVPGNQAVAGPGLLVNRLQALVFRRSAGWTGELTVSDSGLVPIRPGLRRHLMNGSLHGD